MTTCRIDARPAAWLEIVEGKKKVHGKRMPVCNDQELLAKYVRHCFDTEDIYIDNVLLDKYLRLQKYFPFEELFPWEVFCIAMHLCTFWRKTGQPRWPELFLLIGRGAGKDGFIAFEGFCLVSPHSGLKAYDVDVCANSEEQALRPVDDVVSALDAYSMKSVKHRNLMEKHFRWTRERVMGKKLRGTMRGRTSNPKSKDGMRSGIVVFNEIHQYANYKIIKVFVTGLGKKKHPRRLYATTNGDVRGGPLDDMVERSEQILKGDIGDNGMFPFLCRLDDKEEAHKADTWAKANPSLPYMPDLQAEMVKEYHDWKENPLANADFMTKRMNRPQSDTEVVVTSWEKIAATKRPIIDLMGLPCTVGIDYARIIDMASANLHFLVDGMRYDINHSWLCLRSPDLSRITAPWREWVEAGLITAVDDVEISPELIMNWIMEQALYYRLEGLALDNYRFALMKNAIRAAGWDPDDRERTIIVRPSDIMKVQPVIESAFAHEQFVWDDNPVLRWATNNTKLMRGGRAGVDTGNFYYAKIEGKSRKTDPFMALVHSMVIEDRLESTGGSFEDLPVIIG